MRIFDVIVENPSKPIETSSSNIGVYIGIIVGAVVLLIGSAILIYFLKKRKKQ